MNNFCPNCGKELTEKTLYCSNCGTNTTAPTAHEIRQNTNCFIPKQEKYNTMSILGAVIAGVSIFLNFWGIVGIAAVILSVLGLLQIQRTNEKGRGLAITGIIIGTFSILYGFFMIMLFI